MKFKHYQSVKNNIFIKNESGEYIEKYSEINPKEVHPLVLAYIGDAYFHLDIRSRLLHYNINHVRILNDISMDFVSAKKQAKIVKELLGDLDEIEISIYRRAKNSTSHAPRVASISEYHMSTGFEAVLGYLYLEKQSERLDLLCSKAFKILIKSR